MVDAVNEAEKLQVCCKRCLARLVGLASRYSLLRAFLQGHLSAQEERLS